MFEGILSALDPEEVADQPTVLCVHPETSARDDLKVGPEPDMGPFRSNGESWGRLISFLTEPTEARKQAGTLFPEGPQLSPEKDPAITEAAATSSDALRPFWSLCHPGV